MGDPVWVDGWPCHPRVDFNFNSEPNRYTDHEVDAMLAERVLRCSCGNPPTCIGAYEGPVVGVGCDTCCGHWNEDGRCDPISDADFAHDIREAMLLFEAVNTEYTKSQVRFIALDAYNAELWRVGTGAINFPYGDDGIPAAIRLASLKTLELSKEPSDAKS